MRIYSSEELDGKLQAFPDTYESYMGEPLNIDILKGILLEQLQLKQRQFIEQAFSNMSVSSLKAILSKIDKRDEKPEVKKKKEKEKK